MLQISGHLLSEDREIATIRKGEIIECNESLLPLYLQRTKNLEGWLASRAIDTHRTNSRLIKRALRIHTTDDAEMVLTMNAASITDRYWFKPEGSSLNYEDIRYKENYFDTLALRGDPDGFSRQPSRTPELTNIGSFEKCWRLIDGSWWMVKNENANERFSELFLCKLGEKLGFPMAHYELEGDFIRSLDFTEGTECHLEPLSALMDDNDDYADCFRCIYQISPELARQYLQILWLDTIGYNMDRHTGNLGFLRDIETGEIRSMAPNYDNNIALISRGYPKSAQRQQDGLVRIFLEFLECEETALEMYRAMSLPAITEEMIDECFSEIPLEVDKQFIREFILNGYEILRNYLDHPSASK